MQPTRITPVPEPLSFVERLRTARKRASLTQDELAHKVGTMFTGKPCTEDIVKSWERGRTEPRRTELAAICRATNVSADWLLGYPLEDQEETTSWYRERNGRSGTHYLRPVADVIDLTRPFPHHVPVECDGQVALPLPDSCPVNLTSEHHGLTPAA